MILGLMIMDTSQHPFATVLVFLMLWVGVVGSPGSFGRVRFRP